MTQELLKHHTSAEERVDALSRTPSLPPDLQERAVGRLGAAAVIYACAYFLAYGSVRLTQDFAEVWGRSGLYISDFTAAGFILLSLGMFAVARSHRVESHLLLDIGLIYEVVGAAGIEIGILFMKDWPQGMPQSGLSWTCVWIIVYPLLVPSTLGKTLLAALAAASMQPLLYVIAVARGLPPLPGSLVFMLTLPTYICAGIALASSRVVYRLGTDLGRARRMGSYRLVRKLGVGGMGEVWKAEHGMLARSAAIKLIRSGGLGSGSPRTESQLQRFEREVQATALLRSPHTVQVYDYGITAHRTFYYVMELLDGLNLDELVRRYGPVPPARVLRILRQACHSLAEAHERGLVHRDIKPANIFLCHYGREYDFVKVLDFGLVRRAGRPSQGEVGLTRVGTFIGTPAYGSPEMALGSPDIDGATDIYSLGCVAYWLLTGHSVFQAPTVALMLVKHLNEPPEPPSRHTSREIPAELDDLVQRCLKKERSERPTAVELEQALTALEGVHPWTRAEARQWWQEFHPTPRQEADPITSSPHVHEPQP